ncbi:MAG: hypothetical protein JWO86_2454 [Myxococcaceae bacterium]|nr:hypothetical protein [Myxococcaceae bacterium]
MFVRSLSFGAAVAAFVLLPLACGSFNADSGPATGSAEGGAGEGGTEGGTGGEGGAGADGQASEGSTSSAPFVLGTGYKDLRAITATETDVFFVDQAGGGGVFTVPIIGGKIRVLATGGAPSSVAVDGDYVYWTDPPSRTIARIDIAGLGPRTMSSPEPGTGFTPSIVVGATGAVVTLIGSNSNTGEIRQYGVDLVAPLTSSPNLTNPFSLTAFGTSLYWTEGGAGYVVSGMVGMPTGKQLYPEGDPEAITADAAGVYWTIPSQGTIRGSLGGAVPITLATGESVPRSIAADGTYVYWTTSNNELRRAGHLDGGMSSLFASGFMALTEMHVRAVAVTSKYVVWLTADGKVLRADSH